MYEAFWRLEDSPFVPTPDPRFLLRAKGHHEILSTLVYGVTSQKGLMALFGDVGTGKTLLCRALIAELPRQVHSVLVLNPYLSGAELVGSILDALGVERGGVTTGELVDALGRALTAMGAAGTTVVVVVDEAQQMSVEALEQIRILSTLETTTRKLLQIVLAGQPELEATLRRPELRQLDQRIGIRCRLRPLSERDTARYVEHRLRIAGLPGSLPFTRAALRRVYRESRGVPRVINLVCDRALAAAFAARAAEITPALVGAAMRELAGGRRRLAPGLRALRRAAPIAASAAGVLLLGSAVAVYRHGWSAPPRADRAAPVVTLASAPAPIGPAAPVQIGYTAAAAVTPPPPAAPAVAIGLTAAAPPPPAAPPDPAPRPARALGDALTAPMLGAWGVVEEAGAPSADRDGWPDLPALAARHGLTATRLTGLSVTDLRAIGLPALVEVSDRGRGRPFLVRRLDGETASLVAPSGEEARVSVASLEASWTRTAWIVWNNVDRLPADPAGAPAAVSALARRLAQLGHLEAPLPTANDERFQQGVRRFQAALGLRPDGTLGQRTVIALARATAAPHGASPWEGR